MSTMLGGRAHTPFAGGAAAAEVLRSRHVIDPHVVRRRDVERPSGSVVTSEWPDCQYSFELTVWRILGQFPRACSAPGCHLPAAHRVGLRLVCEAGTMVGIETDRLSRSGCAKR